MVHGMYLSSAGDLNKTSWPGGSSGRVQTPCALLNWSHWACLLDIRKFLTCSMSMGWEGLPCHWMDLLWRISCGAGIFSPIGMDLRSSRTAARSLLAGKAVLRVVLMVLTCLSMNPFDLGKCGEDVWWAMQWHVRNYASSSDAKGGPLSVDRDIGGPYCEMSSSRSMHRDVADLDITL